MVEDNKLLATKKIIILYVLYYIEMPLTKDQLTNIILENSLIDYFTLNQCIIDLESSGFIDFNENKDTFHISPTGITTLISFENKIDRNIKRKINSFINKNKSIIRSEKDTSATIVKKNEDEYIVILKAFENEMTLIDLSINVPLLQQANLICDKWKKDSDQIFSDIITILTK